MSLQCGQWQLPSEMEIVPGEKANEGIGALTHKYPRRAIFFCFFSPHRCGLPPNQTICQEHVQ